MDFAGPLYGELEYIAMKKNTTVLVKYYAGSFDYRIDLIAAWGKLFTGLAIFIANQLPNMYNEIFARVNKQVENSRNLKDWMCFVLWRDS